MKDVLIYLALIALLFYWRNRSGHNPQAETTATGIVKKGDSTFSFRLYGLDISRYQGDEMDFLSEHQDSLTFIICQSTFGMSVDSAFERNWTLIHQKGFVRGAYHFYYCNDDPTAQANHYWSVVNSLSANDLPPIVDFEEKSLQGISDPVKIQNDLLTFLTLVEDHYGRTPMIYVGPGIGNTFLTNPVFAKYPLWDADYDGKNQPELPATWNTAGWVFWQRTDSVRIDGDTDDFDVFNGNKQALQSFIHD